MSRKTKAKAKQKVAQRRNAEADRPTTPYMEWADGIRARIEQSRKNYKPLLLQRLFPGLTHYVKIPSEHVYLEAEEFKNNTTLEIGGVEAGTKLYRVVMKALTRQKEWKVVWFSEVKAEHPIDQLKDVSKQLPIVAVKDFILGTFEYPNFDEKLAQRLDEAQARRQRRFARQQKGMVKHEQNTGQSGKHSDEAGPTGTTET